MFAKIVRRWAVWLLPAAVFVFLAVVHSQPLYLFGLAWIALAAWLDYLVISRRHRHREQ